VSSDLDGRGGSGSKVQHASSLVGTGSDDLGSILEEN
jgi:hypothetical protein